MEGGGWFNFLVKIGHLFLRNICTFEELKKINIETEEKYRNILYRLLKFYPQFEKTLDDGDVPDEVRNFLLEDLNDCYPTLMGLKENIHLASFPKRIFLLEKYCFLKNCLPFYTWQ